MLTPFNGHFIFSVYFRQTDSIISMKMNTEFCTLNGAWVASRFIELLTRDLISNSQTFQVYILINELSSDMDLMSKL